MSDTMDETRMVKEYRRPAAGVEHRNVALLRPPHVLLVTIRYLLKLWDEKKGR